MNGLPRILLLSGLVVALGGDLFGAGSEFAGKGAEASMARGIGFLNANRHDKPKPWDVHRRNKPLYYYRYDVDEQDSNAPATPSDGPAPCVGLCYYKKLRALEEQQDGTEDEELSGGQYATAEEDPRIVEEIAFEALPTKEPCVGLCHYYKTLGIDNPYEKRAEKRFTPNN